MQKILKEMGQEEQIEEVCQILNYTSFNTMSFVHSHHNFKLVAQLIQSCSKETKQPVIKTILANFSESSKTPNGIAILISILDYGEGDQINYIQ